MTVRVRFAPSPTGYLHVGGARTALFNWLFARKEGGVFVLRIEDTDRERSREEHTRAILHGLEWLGLTWDEGPFFQSEGVERHREDVRRLLERGAAYRDFSTPEELERDREEEKAAGRRLRRARARAEVLGGEAETLEAEGRPFAVRFRVPGGETVWEDRIHGEMRFRNEEIDDFVILRSDGTPTYNLAVVSDDTAMGITHVIRGDDHLSNTPKQILLYEALGRPVPEFGHVPMILGADGRRLSKRHGATAVGEYERQGILPSAMVNFLALLGWNPGDEREVMTLEELVEAFTLERVLRKSAVFDVEKLLWLNGQHLARMEPDELLELAGPRFVERGLAAEGDLRERREWYLHLLDLLRIRGRTLDEIVAHAEPFLRKEVTFDPGAVRKHWARDPGAVAERLASLRERLARAPWEAGALEEALRGLAGELELGAGKLIHPLRVAVTGRKAGPGIFDVLVLLGRERSLARLDAALELLRSGRLPGEEEEKTLS